MNYADRTWVAVGLELLAAEIVFLALRLPLLTDSMRAGSHRWAAWPALFGTLCGHFFGRRLVPYAWAPWVLVALGAVIVWRDLFASERLGDVADLTIFAFFLCVGAILWGRT